MGKTVAIGIQDFGKLFKGNCFYIDKTYFIKEWWEYGDDVTLIARPRRFGKTLAMSMLEHFFLSDMQMADRFLRGCRFGRMKNIKSYREHIQSLTCRLPM